MFDKNVFKEQFRAWAEQFPFSKIDEVKDFCQLYIPDKYKAQYSWLIEQSIEWFTWRQEILQREILVAREYLC